MQNSETQQCAGSAHFGSRAGISAVGVADAQCCERSFGARRGRSCRSPRVSERRRLPLLPLLLVFLLCAIGCSRQVACLVHPCLLTIRYLCRVLGLVLNVYCMNGTWYTAVIHCSGGAGTGWLKRCRVNGGFISIISCVHLHCTAGCWFIGP